MILLTSFLKPGYIIILWYNCCMLNKLKNLFKRPSKIEFKIVEHDKITFVPNFSRSVDGLFAGRMMNFNIDCRTNEVMAEHPAFIPENYRKTNLDPSAVLTAFVYSCFDSDMIKYESKKLFVGTRYVALPAINEIHYSWKNYCRENDTKN